MLRVAIVGHRVLGSRETVRFVAEECAGFLARVGDEHRDVVAVSATAEGADTIFGEAAVSLGIPLEIVRPFRGYESDFETRAARARYRALRRAARSETCLPYGGRSDAAYLAAMRWVASRAGVLLAAWDGRPALGPGGTGNAVRYARWIGRPVVHMDVLTLTVVSDLQAAA